MLRYGFVALIFLLTFIRLFLSVDITDESSYASEAWTFLLEGRLFHSDLFFQGSPSALISPLSYLHSKLFGTEAFILLFRMVYLFCACFTAWISYRFLKRFYPKNRALLCATFFIAFIPFSVGSWSYNTIAYLGVPLSLFLLFSMNAKEAVWSAVVATVVCFSYPPLAVFYGALLIMLWTGLAEVPKASRARFSSGLIAGGVISVSAILILGGESISKILAFTNAFPWATGLGKLVQISGIFWDGFQNGKFWLLPICGAVFFWNKRDRLGKLDPLFILAFLVLSDFTLLTAHKPTGWLPFATLTLLFFFASGRTRGENRPEWIKPILIAGFLSAAVIGYISSNLFINVALGLMLPLQILILESLHDLQATARLGGRIATGSLAAIALYFSAGNYMFFYRDSSLAALNTRIENGPYRFLYTSANRAAVLNQFGDDLQKLSENRRTIFSAYMAPAYLYTDLLPVTGMLYIPDNMWPDDILRLILYRTIEDGEWPDIFVNRTVNLPGFIYQFEKIFIQTGRYKLEIERPAYRMYTRIR